MNFNITNFVILLTLFLFCYNIETVFVSYAVMK